MNRKIIKVSSGFILYDDFNNTFNPRWDLLPNNMNRVLFLKDSISLLPKKDEPLQMLIPVPNDGDFVMQTEISYKPIGDDKAGVIMKSLTGNSVECEFSYDDDINNYKFLKFSGDSSYIVNLRASKDGVTWEDFGNTKFYDGNFIGYYTNSSESEFEIKKCVMYKGNYIVIHGVDKSDKVEIIDNLTGKDLIIENNLESELMTQDRHIIDVGMITLPINDVTLLVTSNNKEVAQIRLDQLYGGDVFRIQPPIEISVEGMNDTGNGFELGEIHGDTQTYTLIVKNNGTSHKAGKLKVEQISSYEKGHEMVYLSPYDSTSDDIRLKELEVTLPPGQDFKCVLKIVKNSKYVTIDDSFRFNIVFI